MLTKSNYRIHIQTIYYINHIMNGNQIFMRRVLPVQLMPLFTPPCGGIPTWFILFFPAKQNLTTTEHNILHSRKSHLYHRLSPKLRSEFIEAIKKSFTKTKPTRFRVVAEITMSGSGSDSNDGTPGLQAIKYQRGKLEVLDQLKLPHEFEYENVTTCEMAFDCIKAMRVRGNAVAVWGARDETEGL